MPISRSFLGFLALRLSVLVNAAKYSPCPNSCSGAGRCTTPWGVCECFSGFTGADCSLRTCPHGAAWSDSATANDSAHHSAECSNRGKCDRNTGQCVCELGMFEGSACERFVCPSDCSNRGRCVSSKALARMRDAGEIRKTVGCLSTDICQNGACSLRDYASCKTPYVYETPWEAQLWFGCHCDEGYAGYDCSVRTCPTGDDPLTVSQSNDVQLLECHADFGTFTLAFEGQTTTPISVDASVFDVTSALSALTSLHGSDPKVAVSWTVGVTTACSDTGNNIQVAFLQNFGDVPLIIPDGTQLGQTSASYTPIITSQKVFSGDKEADLCSGHGTCDEDKGICQCFENWMTSDGYGGAGTRGDCGYRSTGTTSTCPGEPACLGHGTCSGSPNYRCNCETGRSGADCSLVDCPKSKSWFSFPTAANVAHADVDCSDMGTCDRATGLCKCASGFTGAACQYISCPLDCSSNGECVSMETLAVRNEVDGVPTPYTYGTDPNSNLSWDRETMFGCHCSDGWEGHDCLLKSCPNGDDPHTQHQHNEVQQLSCTDSNDAGSFQLSFRGQSVSISATNTAAELQTALVGITTIENVSVTYNDSNIYVGAPALAADALQICRATGQLIDIEFLSPTGNVPAIVASDSSSVIDGTLSITTTQVGTKEDITCSGRGICAHSSGLCNCFPGYGSSDGQGNSGSLRDCGYKSPYVLEQYNA